MSIYGIISILRTILAYNLVICQHLSMKPSLFDKYHYITYSLQVSSYKNILRSGFYGKNHKILFISVRVTKTLIILTSNYIFHNSFCRKLRQNCAKVEIQKSKAVISCQTYLRSYIQNFKWKY